MNKLEIEKAIIEECKPFINDLKNVSGIEGITLLRKKLWKIGDKYNTDGDCVFNIIMKHFKQLENGGSND
ncbi:hypothetical protein [Sporosalibacterium faouarense]|uniref:hypothetical protein n=1 Tax=Sporosalibacterium faouarense TaxID=516123 RepID=UPI00192ABA9F|nr:hypothetical protein [Sporosalibacterium faouarense]